MQNNVELGDNCGRRGSITDMWFVLDCDNYSVKSHAVVCAKH